MSRSYNKKSQYWDIKKNASIVAQPITQLITPQQVAQPILQKIERVAVPIVEYGFPDEEGGGKRSAKAGYSGGSYSDSYQNSVSPTLFPNDPFPLLSASLNPYETNEGHNYFALSRAIVLCQQAYANVSIFRNAIECAVEFSNSPLHIKTSNQTVKDFFTAWFDKIDMFKLKDNFFREYYRSGNVFLYRFNGHIDKDQFGQMKSVFGSKTPSLPIRYVNLNPAQIYLISGISYNNNYVKALSRYEIERLKTPLTDEDKQVFNSLPENVKSLIKSGGSFREVFIPLDRERLRFAFYKKQDYEPLALPFGFPILNDLEWKLDLKKMDMSLSKTIDHVILLITNGEKVDQYGGGINPQNIINLQEIFKNRSLGRVLIADHSTKGEWLIPDIASILGPDKYKQVEKDIAQGLSCILFDDSNNSKLANALIKARSYAIKLGDGQRAFLNNFLIPEIKEVCEGMGFRDVPEITFEEINLEDNSQRERLLSRLYELGVLSPDEIINAINTGILPDSASNIISQKLYKPLKDNELYVPVMSKPNDGGDGRPVASTGPKTVNKSGPKGSKTAKGEQLVAKYNVETIAKITNLANNIKDCAYAKLKEKFNISELNSEQISVADSIIKNLMINEAAETWTDRLNEYLENPQEANGQKLKEVNEISNEYELPPWESIIVSKSAV